MSSIPGIASTSPTQPPAKGSVILSRIIGLFSGLSGLAVAFVPAIQSAIGTYVSAHPATAGIVGFAALVLSSFLPRAQTSTVATKSEGAFTVAPGA